MKLKETKLANILMVKKASWKWQLCIDFTDLSKACPKKLYLLPSIDMVIDDGEIESRTDCKDHSVIMFHILCKW